MPAIVQEEAANEAVKEDAPEGLLNFDKIPLGGSFIGLLTQANRENRRSIVEQTVRKFLVNETLTFGDSELVDVEQVDIDWRTTTTPS